MVLFLVLSLRFRCRFFFWEEREDFKRGGLWRINDV